MASFRINEFNGYAGARPFAPGVMNAFAFIRTQVVTVGSSVSTNTLSSATQMITLDSDAGCTIFIGSSASTGVAVSSGIRIAANLAPLPILVQPYARLCTLST